MPCLILLKDKREWTLQEYSQKHGLYMYTLSYLYQSTLPEVQPYAISYN